MDEQRALLDQLMGTTRDLSETQKGRVHKIRFSDHEVCKNYLCGLCPFVAFAATKSDMGKCEKRICNSIEADSCKAAWNELSSKEKDRYGYERDLMHCLDNIVKSCDRKIDKQKHRTDQDLIISEESVKNIYTIYKQISDCLSQCEENALGGNVDHVYDLMKQVSQMQDTASKIANPPDEKRNIVCETSGNYMSSRDNDERMRAHFEGKQYLGWKLVREKLRDLKDSHSRNSSRNYGGMKSSRGDRRDSDIYRDRDRDRERARDRDGSSRVSRDRDRSRERDRDVGRRKVYDGENDRDRTRSNYSTHESRSDRRNRDKNRDSSRRREKFGRDEGEAIE